MNKPKILFLEDDTLLAQSIIEELEFQSYEVSWVNDGAKAAEACYDEDFDLYLFDVNVPEINGYELLQSLRENGDTTAAIFLTSKNKIEDLRKGFSSGADDYISKPFDLNELLIRIEAKMPRLSEEQLSQCFSIDRHNTLIVCNNISRTLAAKEFDVLVYLLSYKNVFRSADDIINDLYPDNPISIATLRTYIKNLKRHLEGCAQIENIKNVGYKIVLL
ncbi:response regulator transcription factor [Sulfurimonas sp. MAG313]|nr:response regulator transcription factor [Sulfurimonas sp. MAG313]MDF1880790.1 response regulator transcription factor [Sulfurimonas sp. MAG313]